uniref:ATP-dependent RNA helicase n=1 Tax=Globisporangium ultimum (strain ATCC 200006 / CBS 805.95 / DAOM BR144) TaxID=431595 RepID=K3WQ09_GLOUD
MKFREFKPALCEEILAEVDTMGFTHMTPVQAATLPLFLSNKDVCVDACTGSGKTLAFVLPIIQILKTRMADNTLKAPRDDITKLVSLIISPTRELARQIYECACTFFAKALPKVKVLLFVGGTSVDEDLKLIRSAAGKCSVVIGTPGRTEDLMNRCIGSTVETRDFEILILDEADTLLDMGFEVSINKILEHLPKQRRTGLFSATQTQEVKALARAGLRNPATISVQVANNTQITPSTLKNFYALVSHEQRLSALYHFLQSKKTQKMIVFFSTCSAVDFFSRVLEHFYEKEADEFPIVALHGKMPQKKRTTNYDRFVALKSGILVCTDVVARGIDLPDVDWIIQYDPPQDPNFFVHRVGRTARAGRTGSAISFLSANEDAYVNFLKIRKVPCEEMKLPLDEIEDMLPKVKELILSDRDILEKGTKAYISFVRSYKEHQCQFIFRFKELDLGAVARGFALFKLPKINELRNVRINFQNEEIKTKDIKYKDKVREKERQKKLVEIEAEKERQEKIDADAREKKRKRAEELNDDDDLVGGKKKQGPRRREKKKGLHQQIVEEWDELAEEEKLYKKLKRGKITEEEYEKALLGKGEASDVDDDADSDDEEGATKQKKPKWKIAEEKMKERFKKKEMMVQKTGEQKRQAAKREEKIRARKKAQHVQRQQQRMQRRGRA